MDKRSNKSKKINILTRSLNVLLLIFVMFILVYTFREKLLDLHFSYVSKNQVENIYKINSDDSNSGKININFADASELQSIPYINEKLANAIVEFRKQNGLFDYVEDLIYVKGIGEKTFNKIKKYIYVKDN